MTNRARNAPAGKTVKARIRKFEANDTAHVLELAERYASWDITPTKADIEGLQSTNPEFFLVAESDNKILGFAYGAVSSPPTEVLEKWRSTRVASVETLVVDEAYRRRGIAKLLLTSLFEKFKEKGIDLVTLSVPAVETGAMKLYEKMGFEPRAYFLWKRLVE